ncbi:MAG: hypothetical protein V1905_00845 [bacterium]
MDSLFTDLVYMRFLSPTAYLVARFLFVGFSVLAVTAIALLIPRISWTQFRIKDEFAAYTKFNTAVTQKITKTWLKVTSRLNTNIESEYKLALIEADDILDKALKTQGFQGETVGDRLKEITSDIIINVDGIKEAHKVRNNIIHDPDYHLTYDTTRKSLDAYENTLKGFGLL